ncbi:MAG TPA: tRNA 2-selenouridine(34) synthase MnmH [Bacteroidales bacterium]|nr:tRNA 2-selenouridine(34) synthase MnmH [Bacteroidales bacterium]
MEYIEAADFLTNQKNTTIVDVRSPSEFRQGHIPGAVNIALFDDEERKIVGTLYKKTGRNAAILKGMELVGPKLKQFVIEAQEKINGYSVLLHCWRGGLRSKNMAFLFETAGYRVNVLTGGYKAYRHYIRQSWEQDAKLIILGGKTGSGKSDVLQNLKMAGEQVLELEEIAHHRGSAFGDLGQSEQPTTEQFENNLYEQWRMFDFSKPVWIEDESKAIGRVSLPDPLFVKIRSSNVLFIDVDKEERINRLVKNYADFDPNRLEAAIHRIAKRLGGLNEKKSVEALFEKDYETVANILLYYYDKAYLKGLGMRDQEKVYHLPCSPEKDINIVNTLKQAVAEMNF